MSIVQETTQEKSTQLHYIVLYNYFYPFSLGIFSSIFCVYCMYTLGLVELL